MRGTGPGTEFQFSFHGPGGSVADTLLTGPGVTFSADWTARSVGAGNGGNGGIASGLNGDGDVIELINSGSHPDYLSFLHAIQNGDIRVGVVTEGYANGLSATYVTNVVPELCRYRRVTAPTAINPIASIA